LERYGVWAMAGFAQRNADRKAMRPDRKICLETQGH